MKTYTIGEIFRLGLLKNHKGLPYTAKATVSRIVSGLPYKEKVTPFGISKLISQKQIDALNAKWDS